MAYSEKHKQIIRIAEILFAKKGYAATTVRDIAEMADINIAMISYYFGSKEKLLEALFAERMEAATHRIHGIDAMDHLNPWQKLQMLVDEYTNNALQRQDFYKIVVCEQVINKNHQVLHNLKTLKLYYARIIGKIISEGQKKKMFKKNADPVMLLTSMTGTVMHMIVNQDYYREFHRLTGQPDEAFNKIMIKNLRNHIHKVFQITLGYEP